MTTGTENNIRSIYNKFPKGSGPYELLKAAEEVGKTAPEEWVTNGPTDYMDQQLQEDLDVLSADVVYGKKHGRAFVTFAFTGVEVHRKNPFIYYNPDNEESGYFDETRFKTTTETMEGVVTVFQRYSDDGTVWVSGSNFIYDDLPGVVFGSAIADADLLGLAEALRKGSAEFRPHKGTRTGEWTKTQVYVHYNHA